MVGGLAFGDETFLPLDDRKGGVLNLPLADVTECFAADGSFLSGFRGRPTV